MPDLILSPRSGLEHVLVPGHFGAKVETPGVVISHRSDLALAAVMARRGRSEDLCRRSEEVFGIAPPRSPRHVGGSSVGFAWAGPDRWLATSSSQTPRSLEDSLRKPFAGLASVTDQSDGRRIVRVSGPKTRDAMAKGAPLDLNPRAFGTGDTALTIVAHINVHLWQVDDAPTYELVVFRSYVVSFCEWLLDAAAEFGGLIR